MKRRLSDSRGKDRWILATRTKNLDTMAKLGMTFEDIRLELLSLTPEEYLSGPEDDPDIEGQVWKFQKIVSRKQIYIKLKLWGDERREPTVRVLSFHM